MLKRARHALAAALHAGRKAWHEAPAAASAHRAEARPDIPAEDMSRLSAVDGLTMTGVERRYALLQAVRHLQRWQIPGDIVECGVWRGGSMALVARALLENADTTRTLWLYDTFTGMTQPGDLDCDHAGTPARELLAAETVPRVQSVLWAEASLEDVRHTLSQTGYPAEKMHFIAGPVEQTIPAHLPERIALLRLDTDWYESTRHELAHLYQRVTPGGVIIVDDYGCWQGARRAVDEFLASCPEPILLHRVDETGRVWVKPRRTSA
jgi:predicted O-methyltransferase YrrM